MAEWKTNNFLSQAIEVAQIQDESVDINSSDLVFRCIDVSDSRISSSLQAVQSSTNAFFSFFSASRVYSKVALLGVSFIEREQRYVDYNFCWVHL